MEPEVIYNIQQGPFWDWKVALDLFLGGAGVGALLFAIFIDEQFKGKYKRICSTAAWLAPILIAAGLALVILKMGRPFRIHYSLINFNPHSAFWWGGIFQPLLVIGAFFYAKKWKNPDERTRKRRTLGRILIPISVIVGVYHGLLLSVMVSRPVWNNGSTVIAALIGFALTGIAAVMLIHLLRMKIAGRLNDEQHIAVFLDDIKIVRNTIFILLIMQIGTFILWWLSLSLGSTSDILALEAATMHYGNLFWFWGVGIGLILPLLLGVYAVWKGDTKDRNLQVRIIVLTSIFILIGGFMFRLSFVLGGQLPLPVTVGF